MEKTETKPFSFVFPYEHIPSGAAGTSIAKYQPVIETDEFNTAIKKHCITFMKEYESKSLEELRFDDYSEDRKGSQLYRSFGSKTQQSSEQTVTNSNILFGTTSSNQSVFGSTNSASTPAGLLFPSSSSTTSTADKIVSSAIAPGNNIFGHVTAATSVENKSTFETTTSHTIKVPDSKKSPLGSIDWMKKNKRHLKKSTSDKNVHGCSSTAAPVGNKSISGKISLFDTRNSRESTVGSIITAPVENKTHSGFAFGKSVCDSLTSESKSIFIFGSFGLNVDGSNTATSVETKTLPANKSVIAENKSLFGTNPFNKSIFGCHPILSAASKNPFDFIEPINRKPSVSNIFNTVSSSDATTNPFHIKPATPTPKTCSTCFSTNNSDDQSGSFETKEKTQFTTMELPSYFSWKVFEEKLNSALDNKLQNLPKNEDLSHVNKIEKMNFDVKHTNEIEELLVENKNLKADLKVLQSKLEQVDRSNRRYRIFVRGLISRELNAATDEFLEICARHLETTVQVTDSVKLHYGQAFVFTLASTAQVSTVIARRASLKNAAIFIEKDYTVEERNKRYQLRMLSKKLNALNKYKIRLGEFSLVVNGKSFYWLDDAIVAESKEDADFLKEILVLANCSNDVKERFKAEVRFLKDSESTRHTKSPSISDTEGKTRKSDTSTLSSRCSMLLDIEDAPEKKAACNVSLKPENQLRRKSY